MGKLVLLLFHSLVDLFPYTLELLALNSETDLLYVIHSTSHIHRYEVFTITSELYILGCHYISAN